MTKSSKAVRKETHVVGVGGCNSRASLHNLVSVIIPFLDSEQFLDEAIASVVEQTYSHWEVLLIDDGSSDGSTAIARAYVQRDPERVRYLEHPGHANRGAAASRNLGLQNAAGSYVAFLDADDVWLPHKLEQQVALLDAYPEAGMIFGASRYWYGWTGQPEDAARDRTVRVGAPQDALARPPELLTLLHPLGKGAAPCVSSLVARRSVIEAVKGFEEGFRGIHQLFEDQAFLTKVYLVSPVFVSSECLDFYRQSPTSCVSRVTGAGNYHPVREGFLVWLEDYLLAQGKKDSEVWHALQRVLGVYRHPIRWYAAELRRRALAAFG